ncbi:MAG TPA: DNA polymerase III subunit alpha [Methylomirabilota bacterium]|nr:DNA polymerase III subunit alpha [Methylomirabilota bacterium]
MGKDPRGDFVHLHVHSEYSLLDGAAQLDKLVEAAKGLGFPAIALTDHGNLFGAIDFYTAAKKAGIKPIVGCELYVAPGSRFERSSQDGGYEGASHCTVLVRNETGYRNLVKLVSKAYLEGFYYKPRVDRELLAQHADGLLVLSGCLNSEVSKLLSAGEDAKAKQVAGWYQDVFGRDHYFMEIQSHGIDDQAKVTAGTLRIAEALGAPICGTNDSHYLEASHAKAHEALLCIQTGTTMSDPNRWRFSTEEFYLKSADQMREVFRELPEAHRNTLAVAERCDLQLAFGKFHLPNYQLPVGFETLDGYLEHLAVEGLRARYGASPADPVVERLRYELGVISKMGFSGYFLVVWDFIAYARRQGIAVGPGRGSSAGSLVAYCLSITNVDPIRYGLLFERFLNPERISMPDMDIDFADDRRDEVIRYVVDRYGEDRVAHIITFGTMGAKAVIRDVGRVLGFSYGEADRIAKLVPSFPLNISLDESLEKSPELAQNVKRDPRVGELWSVAKALEGGTRHASVHASAVVISDEPLMDRVPLYKDPKRPELITGFAMGPIEKLGLLKMDFLGLKTLTVITDAVNLVKASRGIELDADRLPLDDPRTYQLLSEARTLGVFQLESQGMRDALQRLRPERIEDIIAMVALYRPGPMDLIPDFVNRKHGRAEITYEHPAMEKHLQETYGIMVYQEQVMRLAADLAGFSLAQADILRKAMGKKDRELMAQQREEFIKGCKAHKVDGRKAERIWDLIEKFAGYGFNKCLTADTEIEMADGTRRPITAIRPGDRVLTKDGAYRALGARPSGTRTVGELRLANGMTVRCTPDHPIFTQRGWVNAEEVAADDFVAVARELPAGAESVPAHHAALLGYALSEGSLGYEGHFYLYSSSQNERADMAAVMERFPNTMARIEQGRDGRAGCVRPARRDRTQPSGAVAYLFGTCGLRGQRAIAKRLPALTDRWDRAAIAVLVAKLFQGDGCIHAPSRSIFYATSSEGLALDVRRLLLKLGLSSTIHRKSFAYRGGRRPGFTVNLLGGRDAFSRFATEVGPHLLEGKRRALTALLQASADTPRLLARGTVDVIPRALCLMPVREAIAKAFPSLQAGCRALGVSYRLMFSDGAKGGLRRDTLRYLAEELDSPALHALADAPTGWSRPRGYVVTGEEPTYDFEVPVARSFIANGIAVHNSHAACYGLVAYQTAYLKANYPVEFMAALLTSEMERTDKIVQYIEECRAMGLRVAPPDVNRSGARFTVDGDTIRFGLAAIKNVGETAIESIVQVRQESGGAFGSLTDFCARVDLRLLNRRVLESLIKAGAFDGGGATRAALLAGLDQAMEAGQRRQRDREEGQASLFDAPGAAPAAVKAESPLASVPEWPTEQLLGYEKEVLGFYLSGHPLERYKDHARQLGTASAADVAARPVGARVALLGQVSQLRERATKSGNRMAFASLDAVDGAVALTIFPEALKTCGAALHAPGPVLVKGRIDETDKGRVVLVEDVKPLEESLLANGGYRTNGRSEEGNGRHAHACRIRMRAGNGGAVEPATLTAVRAACDEHRGATPLFVHVLLAEQEVVLKASPVAVEPGPELVAKVERLLGPGSIIVEYAGRA